MTPTTAEQMPDFKWLSDMADRLANGYVLNRAERQSFSEMHTLLNSWLAQGGARGGEHEIKVMDLSEYEAVLAFLCRYRGQQAAALAPRAEAACEKCGGAGIVYVNEYHDEAPCPACKSPRAEAREGVWFIPTAIPEHLRPLATEALDRIDNDTRPVEQWADELAASVYAKPTAACGVSGLVAQWNAPRKKQADDPHDIRHEVRERCADELEAALNAGALAGGEVSEGDFFRGMEDLLPRGVNADLLDDAIQKLAKSSYALGHHETLRSSDDDTVAYWTKYTEEAKQRLRSLVVGGVGQ